MAQHLIIENKAIQIKLEGKALNITYPDRKPTSVPLRLLDQITFLVDVTVPVQTLHKLAQNGINIGFLNARNPELFTECTSTQNSQYKRREKQYALIHSQPHRIDASQKLVAAKLQRQSNLLAQLSRVHYRQRRVILKGQQAIEAMIPSLNKANEKQLLGMEGTAARLYFDSFTQVFADEWNFTGRNKRPPKDPVNALLSLGYTMMTREASKALHQAGLDPAFGFYHKVSSGRHSLACDLAEVYRCHIDQLVYQIIKNGQLRPHHFGYQLQACLLTKEGRKIFFPLYQAGIKSCRRALRLTAHQWANALMACSMPDWHKEV